VTPSVEVKRGDLADVTPPDDEDANSNTPPSRNPSAAPQPDATPPVVVAPKPADDLMLKKAVEVLTTGVKAKKKAA